MFTESTLLRGDHTSPTLDVDIATLSNSEVLAEIAAVEAARRAQDARMLRLVTEAERRKIAVEEAAPSTVALLRSRLLLHPSEAATLVRVGRATTAPDSADHPPAGRAGRRSPGECADTGKALAAGEITLEHARVIVDALADLTRAVDVAARAAFQYELLEAARELDPKELAAIARNRGYEIDPGADARHAAAEARAHDRRGVWLEQNFARPGGRVIANLDSAGFAAAQAAIDALSAPDPSRDSATTPSTGTTSDAEAGADEEPVDVDTVRDPRTAGQRRADALVELFTGALTRGEVPITGGHRPQVVVTVPLATLRGQLEAAGTLASGATISAETARLLACDAVIIPAVLGTRSEVLDLGEGARLATAAQRRALAVHYRGCAFPGCRRPMSWCSAHHVRHWADNGPTDLSNLIPLCGFHHTVVHHAGWRIERNPDDASTTSSRPDEETCCNAHNANPGSGASAPRSR
jgi:hypothetical protein